MYGSWDNALHKGLAVWAQDQRRDSTAHWQHLFPGVSAEGLPCHAGEQTTQLRFVGPTGPTSHLKPHCLASAWSTAPATFHLHHGLCSSMPIFHPTSDLPLRDHPIPREASDARGWGSRWGWDRLPLLPLPAPHSTWHSNVDFLPFTLHFLPY